MWYNYSMNWYGLRYLQIMLRTIIICGAVILFIRSFIVEPGRVNGRSMEDTFIDANLFFVNKFELLRKPPQRGEIIQFIDPESNKSVMKRIIGLPGETIKISKGKVFLILPTGEIELHETYLQPETFTYTPSKDTEIYENIGPYEYFVLGDNRTESIDSREYGTIHRSYIMGTVTLQDQPDHKKPSAEVILGLQQLPGTVLTESTPIIEDSIIEETTSEEDSTEENATSAAAETNE